MRSNQQNKNRSRGRNGGRKNVNPLSRNFESNGPDVKIRGNAAHIAERYVQLARDATASGDSVTAENYLQHAEHYFRILSAAQAQMQPRNEPNFDVDNDDGDDLSGGFNGETDTTAQPDTPSADRARAASAKPEAAKTDSAKDDSGKNDSGKADSAKPDSAPAESEAEAAAPSEEPKPRARRTRRRRPTEGEADPASAPQPDVGELPAFLTGANPASAAE